MTGLNALQIVCMRLQVVDRHTMLAKQILHPTSGHVVPGEIMALVGPSGAGVCHCRLLCMKGSLQSGSSNCASFERDTDDKGLVQGSPHCWIFLRSGRAVRVLAR